MSKSYKLKGDNYIDSSSIVHNQNILEDELNNISWVDKSSELVLDQDTQASRTKLFINKRLRLVYLQIRYFANINNVEKENIVSFPLEYAPKPGSDDVVWFPFIPSSGGNQIGRGVILVKNNKCQVNCLCIGGNLTYPYGYIVYPY